MKLLHIDSSILGDHSVSRQISAAAVARLQAADSTLEVTYRDLAIEPIDHLTAADLPGEGKATHAALEEFLAADVVVIGAPMYNFTLPSQLKAWLDRILVAGKTFGYGPNGPEGLAGGKRVIVAVTRGGFYNAASPNAAFEHLETYLRGVFGFIGIVPEIVVAEGMMVGPDERTAAVDDAMASVAALAA